MLFPLFIPAAFYALHLREQLKVEYFFTEHPHDLTGQLESISFNAPNPLLPSLNDQFEKQGVSFHYGIPDEFPGLEYRELNPFDKISSMVGLSVYPLKLSNGTKGTISCLNFRGPMVIAFHKPGKPNRISGVHKIGFYLSRIDHPNAAEVSIYSPSGKLMKQYLNSSTKHVFMGFESTQPIGWLEINMIGQDETYALGELSYSRLKITSASGAREANNRNEN